MTLGKCIVYLTLSMLIATLQWRLTLEILTIDQFIKSLQATHGVLEGQPHWMVYQSRLLGPWLVSGLGEITGNLGIAYAWFIGIGFTVANYVFLWAISPLFSGTGKLAGLSLFVLFTLFFIDDMWLYPWDICSLILFSLFLGLVVRETPLWQYFLLFLFMLFNRESVHFLSIFVLIKPICDLVSEKNFYQIPIQSIRNRHWIVVGSSMLIVGFLSIYWLRETLLVEEIGPVLFKAPELAGATVHFNLDFNLQVLKNGLSFAGSGIDLALALFFLLSLVLVVISLKYLPTRYLAYTIVQGLMLVAIALIGIINETRIFFELVPYLTFSILHLTLLFSGESSQSEAHLNGELDHKEQL